MIFRANRSVYFIVVFLVGTRLTRFGRVATAEYYASIKGELRNVTVQFVFQRYTRAQRVQIKIIIITKNETCIIIIIIITVAVIEGYKAAIDFTPDLINFFFHGY